MNYLVMSTFPQHHIRTSEFFLTFFFIHAVIDLVRLINPPHKTIFNLSVFIIRARAKNMKNNAKKSIQVSCVVLFLNFKSQTEKIKKKRSVLKCNTGCRICQTISLCFYQLMCMSIGFDSHGWEKNVRFTSSDRIICCGKF